MELSAIKRSVTLTKDIVRRNSSIVDDSDSLAESAIDMDDEIMNNQ